MSTAPVLVSGGRAALGKSVRAEDSGKAASDRAEHGLPLVQSFELHALGVGRQGNERGKGDHRHVDGVESPYTFVSVEQLVEDFIAAVAARRAT